MSMLSAVGLRKNYSHLQVLKGVDLQVEKGEIVAILGSSGAGKSTLLHILGTLDTPTSGEVWLDGALISTLKGKKLSQFRNQRIGFIFQFHHLLAEFTALENTCIPALISGRERKKEILSHGKELLGALGLADRMDHKPAELSGGEQQRVAVARALVNRPLIVLADEPTGNLDSANALELHQLFKELRSKYQQTFVIVTHNETLARISDRQLRMRDGRMVEA